MIETFKAYRHQCRNCEAEHGLAPDYYGLIYPEAVTCPTCLTVSGFDSLQEDASWYYWYCFPGCLPDSDPIGPFSSEEEAIKDSEND